MKKINSGLRHWQPSLFIIASAVLHFVAILFVLLFPNDWLWALAIIMCDHLMIVALGLLPRSQLLGMNWTKLPEKAAKRGEIALTIDDGPNPEITPQVLDILDEYAVKATFFCIGEQAQKYPALCYEIVQRGHTVENHTQHHWHYFSLLIRPMQIRAEIATAQQSLFDITRMQPLFFRPTAGLRNFLLEPVLCQLGLHLVSWTRRGFDTRQSDSDIVLRKLLANLKAGDILLLHDRHCAHTVNGVPMIIAVLPRLLEAVKLNKLHPVTLRAALL